MRHIYSYIPLSSLLLFCIPIASAQSSLDVNIGFGSTHVKSSGTGIDNASSSNAFGSCLVSSADPFCLATPSLGGFFMGLGGDVMLQKHYGFGAEIQFQPAKGDYGPLQYRQIFYDFNGIYAPVNEKRFMVQLQGGVGGARTSFSFTQSSCVGTAVCTTQNLPVGNSSHFQVHLGVGVQILVTEHLFVRPQFDLRYMPNFDQQFGANTVPGGMIWVGYNWGSQ